MESQEEDSSVVEAAISGPDEIVQLNSPETSPTLLPENWEVILRDLPSTDFLSAINSNPQWNQLMNSKKPSKLFPLVFPMLMDYLPLKDTLELRLANKSVLKEAVDTQLQKLSACPISEFGYIPSWKENVNNPQTKVEVMRNKFEFEKQEQLQSFLQLTESIFSCGGNPFLSGNLSIQLGLNGVDDGDDGQALS
ncbi:hypothetical protein Ocin01_16419 [Orchesella cincta]|uniref:Uncharacterized protein n=1 Tax=Orchesella cincta TaxID=48709 RepID=A0A1D2MBH1_ORCCI|nr:hypothetical protein Ocin01_16419 [Orchesella cincta]